MNIEQLAEQPDTTYTFLGHVKVHRHSLNSDTSSLAASMRPGTTHYYMQPIGRIKSLDNHFKNDFVFLDCYQKN